MKKKLLRYLLILNFIFTLSIGLMSNKIAPIKHTMTATKYYAGDGCGMTMACGEKINKRRVETFKDKFVALSPDMYNNHGYNFHDTIYVESNNKLIKGRWIVKDKTSSRHKKHIDFLMTKNNSKSFGNGTVKIYIIGKYKDDKNKKKRK